MQVVQFIPSHKFANTTFDLDRAYASINDILEAKSGDFAQLLFKAAQAIIVSLKRKQEPRRELLSIVAQVLIFSEDELVISRVTKLLRGYRQLEHVFAEELYQCLLDNFPEDIKPMLDVIGQRLKPHGFSIQGKGGGNTVRRLPETALSDKEIESPPH